MIEGKYGNWKLKYSGDIITISNDMANVSIYLNEIDNSLFVRDLRGNLRKIIRYHDNQER